MGKPHKLWSKTDKKILLVGTIQGFKKIKNLPIDLIVYDEAHVGYNASDWKRINKKLNCPVIYKGTHTNFKMILIYEICLHIF